MYFSSLGRRRLCFFTFTQQLFYPSVVRDLLSPYASGLLVDCSFLTDTLTRRYLARGTFLFFFFESRVTRAWVIGFWRTSNLSRTLLFHIARAALHSYAVDSHLSRTVPTIPMTGRSVHYRILLLLLSVAPAKTERPALRHASDIFCIRFYESETQMCLVTPSGVYIYIVRFAWPSSSSEDGQHPPAKHAYHAYHVPPPNSQASTSTHKPHTRGKPARQSSAEPWYNESAALHRYLAWILIVAQCSAIPRQVTGRVPPPTKLHSHHFSIMVYIPQREREL